MFHLCRIAVTLACLLGNVTSASAAEIPPAGYAFKPAAPCIEDAQAAQKPRRPGDAVYAVCADQMAIFTKGLADAKAQGKLLLVTFGATWCPWCASLQKAMQGPELLGATVAGAPLGRTFHHIEIGLSTIAKGAKAEIPSGEAVLALVLKAAPGAKIRAIPFLAVVDPNDTSRVFARNMDDVAQKDHSHDLAKARALFVEAREVLAGRATPQGEPGWFARQWRRLSGG